MLSRAHRRAYLDRIGYTGALDRSLETLRALHRAHVFAVPFENLDIHLGKHIPVDVGHAYDKIVGRRRGGYCYELNPLFHALLTGLGFDATIVSARVLLRGGGYPFEHLTIIVHFGEDWLVDVGYGRPPPPLPIGSDSEDEFSNENGTFKILRRGAEQIVMGSKEDGKFGDLFAFEPIARKLHEFEERSRWIQTSPESIFTKAPLCSLPVRNRRMTISGLNYITSEGANADVRKVTAEQRDALLRDVFGIDLDGAKLPDGDDLTFVPGRVLRD